ncbi:hypothetical protein ASD65_04025 [Microbacterium sp. Root61]|uniref:SdpI family protein n=1 Tax=Microbacterium sp. Root61 TaxID=1736570 RepID=UPI0006FBAB23|nr:SdpI family protein [Microbacterium sp. Root61]KRA23685.1 hypothetical protein ASD65_04025 [Microbacterium sp. Root61]
MDDSTAATLSLTFTGLVLAAVGVLMLWLARRSRQGRLPRNQLAGVRTTATLASDAAWFAGQAASAGHTATAGWGTLIGGLAVTAVALLTLPYEVAMTIYTVLTLGTAAWLLGWAIAGGAAGQRAAQAVLDTERL